MIPLRLLFAAAVLTGAIPLSLRAQVPLPPFELALTINDGVSRNVYRGWPILLRGDAVLMRDVAAPFSLDLPSLVLAIAPEQGPALRWPLQRVTEFPAAPVLGPQNESVRVVWLLTAEQTLTFLPGDYTATLSWAGRTAPRVEFSVTAAPAPLSENDEIRRAVLQSQGSLLLGDTLAALGALSAAEARHPQSVELLLQRSKALVQRGEFREALVATHRARGIFERTYPDASHPPRSILQVESQARAGLLKGATPGPRLVGLPGGGARSVAASTSALPPISVVAPTGVGLEVVASAPVVTPGGVASISNAAATPSTPVVRNAVAAGAVASNLASPGSVGAVVPHTDLTDAKIIADPAGQWAASGTAGSQYGRTQYSASQATGKPNVPVVGNSPDAWCPASKDKGTDWLEVTFAQPVTATEVRVRQSDAAGAIAKVEAIEADGTAHVWWEGADPFQPPAVRDVAWFAVRVPKTSYRVARVKLTLNLAAGPGWKQVDAVQLVAAGGGG